MHIIHEASAFFHSHGRPMQRFSLVSHNLPVVPSRFAVSQGLPVYANTVMALLMMMTTHES